MLLPWIPYWSPPHVAAWHGLASSITHKITSALLTGPFQDYGYSSWSYQQEEEGTKRSSVGGNSTTTSRQLQLQHQYPRRQPHRRPLVVYLTRPSTATRHVTNEQEILSR